jgi:hypothetical protein
LGNTAVYLSSCTVKLTAKKKYTEEESFGARGFEVLAELIKSRSSAAGLTCVMYLDQVNGFDNDVSNFLALYEAKRLQGSGNGYWLKATGEKSKFKRKNFLEKLTQDASLKEAFNTEVAEVLQAYIPVPGRDFEPDGELVNVGDLEWNEEYEAFTDGKGNYYDEQGNQLEFVEE